MSVTKVNISLSSKFKKTQVNSIQKLPDITGLAINEFHIDSRLDIVSGEADIYLCSRVKDNSQKSFLLKYYRREKAVKPDVIEKLKTVNSPCVAPIEGFGEYKGHQYVVRPYYEMSALSELLAEGTRFSEEELKNLIIPSIIEGLKAVHDAGILHKDLKPANMIPDDNGEHIVLIDFGISSDAGKNTFVMTQTGMTPFYAAPEAMQGIFHRETDYYALGITIFELFTGFTPFQNPELSGEDVARLAAVSKIEFPKGFPEDLKRLVLGLTYKDISRRNEKGNPNKRWGYKEVTRWLNGEELPIPGESKEFPHEPQFLPYSFDGTRYTDVQNLVRAMLKNPAAGLSELGRGILTHHFGLFDTHAEKLCRDAEEQLQKTDDTIQTRSLFFRLMYSLAPGMTALYCNGKEFKNLKELGSMAVNSALLQDQEFCWDLTILLKSFLGYYASTVIKSSAASGILKTVGELVSRNRYSEEQAAWIIGYMFSNKKNLRIHGNTFNDAAELREYLKKFETKKGFKDYVKYVEESRQELEFFASCYPNKEDRVLLSEILEDLDRAVFGNGELEFRNAEDFDNYIGKLVKEKQAYRLRTLKKRYGGALKEISEKIWNSSSYDDLNNIVAGFASFEERLFVSVQDLKAWLEKFLSDHQDSPDFLKEFVKCHNSTLAELEKRKELSQIIGKLRTTVSGFVVFEEQMFVSATEFNDYIGKILTENQDSPDFLKEFVKCHNNTLNELKKRNDLSQIIKKLMAFANDSCTEIQGSITIKGIKYPTAKPVRKGDFIMFGRYPQDSNGKKSPIEWLVLDVSGNETLIISRYGLDSVEFQRGGAITWEDSFLRKWLNNDFLKVAFSKEEIKRIKISRIDNVAKDTYRNRRQSCTKDQVFCLSTSEAEQYFEDDKARQCQPTELAKDKTYRAKDITYREYIYDGVCVLWWLRTPRYFSTGYSPRVYAVGDCIKIRDSGDKLAVRPALWVNLQSEI